LSSFCLLTYLLDIVCGSIGLIGARSELSSGMNPAPNAFGLLENEKTKKGFVQNGTRSLQYVET